VTAIPLFWALALALLFVTLVVLLWPLLRRRGPDAPSEEAARVAVYRDQKRQLDDDRAAGVITEAEHRAGIEELARRLGLELERADASTQTQARERNGFLAALAVVAIVPAGAIVLYLALGTPDALRESARAVARPSDADILGMVDRLATRMKANPEDPKGWRLLGRSYAALGRYQESSQAYAQAVQRGGEDPDVLADWAEVLALAQNRTVSGPPEDLAKRALALQPDHPKALALLATAAFERGDFDGSLALWQRLQATLPPGSEEATQTAAAIAEVERSRAAGPGGVPLASAAPPPPTPPAARSANAPAAGPSAGAVTGQIDIAPAMAALADPGDTLYVFARAKNGPRMPLAVQRSGGTQWPRAFRLDDSMSMAGGAKLSTTDSLVIDARLSRSGNATPQPGDIVAQSVEAKPGAKDLRIVLDRVLP
jgi:cytochrome c-type biogenesis protein CcmH